MQPSIRALGAIALALGARAADLRAQSTASPAGVPRTLQVNGESRGYFLYLPRTWHRGRPAPLGFVVAYPQGLGGRWNDGRGYAATHDDVGFVRVLLDTLTRELGIDPRRVYATGI